MEQENKYYAFRDLDHDSNYIDGTSYNAAGVVEKIYYDKPSRSGKDLAVLFLDPFECSIISTWRSYDEVTLMEIPEWKYNMIKNYYDKIYLLDGE